MVLSDLQATAFRALEWQEMCSLGDGSCQCGCKDCGCTQHMLHFLTWLLPLTVLLYTELTPTACPLLGGRQRAWYLKP